MPIKIADKFEKASANEAVKLMDAKDVAYDPNVANIVDNPDNVQDAIAKLDSYINAKPLLAIVPSSTMSINDNICTINSDTSKNITIDLINSSIIGNTSSIAVKNVTTGSVTRYNIANKSISTISIGSFSTSGTYEFSISGNDSVNNPFTIGSYVLNDEGNYVIKKLDKTYDSLIIKVIIGNLQLTDFKYEFSHSKDPSDYDSSDDILVVSNDIKNKTLNSINVNTSISYPDVSSETKNIQQILKYRLTTTNLYYYDGEMYKSIYGNIDTLSEIPTDLYVKYTYNGLEEYKPLYDYSELEKTYTQSQDIVTINISDDIDENGYITAELYDPKDINSSKNNHDTKLSNVKFTIADMYFIAEVPHTIECVCNIIEIKDDETSSVLATTEYSINLYPIKLETVYNNTIYSDICAHVIESFPKNIINITNNDQLSVTLATVSAVRGNVMMSCNLYKQESDGSYSEDSVKRIVEMLSLTNTPQISKSINFGVLSSGIYKVEITYTISGNSSITCGDPFVMYIPIRLVESNNDYVKEDPTPVIYWDATNHSNADDNSDTWNSKTINDTEDSSYFFKLYGLNLSTDSNNGWMTEFKKDTVDGVTDNRLYKSFLRFNGKSYAKAYKNVSGSISELTLSDIVNRDNMNAFTVEINYRTSNIGITDACVLSARDEETMDDPSFAYLDNDRYKANPGVTISYNKAVMGTKEEYMYTHIDQNEWKHVTFVFNQQYINQNDGKIYGKVNGQTNIMSGEYSPVSTIKIYVNGVLTITRQLATQVAKIITGQDSVYNDLFERTPQILLNCHKNSAGEVTGFGNCDISSIRIYDKALNDNQIVQNYKSTIKNNNELANIIDKEQKMPKIYFIKNAYANDQARKSKPDDKINNISFNDLFKITEKSESSSNAVNCTMKFEDTDGSVMIMNNIDVYLQGTSTLQFPIKNLKIRAYENAYDDPSSEDRTLLMGGASINDSHGNKLTKKYKFTPNKEDWIPDYCYTLKADYMESAHLNNTPTAMFYDKVVDAINMYDKVNVTGNEEIIDTNDELCSYKIDNTADSDSAYYINNNAEFKPLSEYDEVNAYSGNRYTKSTYGEGKLLRSPGSSYFKYRKNKDIYGDHEPDNDNYNSDSIYLTTTDPNDINLISNLGNLYICMTTENGTSIWEKYDPENENHVGKILYKYINNYCDAIIGFPCLVYYCDVPKDLKEYEKYYGFDSSVITSNFTLLGTMMFNYDKTANALGFEIEPIFEKEYIEYINSLSNTIYDSNVNINITVNELFKKLYNLGINNISDELEKIDFDYYIDHADNYILYTTASSNDHYKMMIGDQEVCFPFLSFADFCNDGEIPVHTKSESYSENKNGEYVYKYSDSKNDILVNDFEYGEDDTKYKYNITDYRIYVHTFSESENGKYVSDNDMQYIKMSPNCKYDFIAVNMYRLGTIEELQDNDIVKYDIENMVSDIISMSSFEGATNVKYASGTFYGIHASFEKGYAGDELEKIYNSSFVSKDLVEGTSNQYETNTKLVYLMDPTTHKYDNMISPSTENTTIPLSLDKFVELLSRYDIGDGNTVDITNTYNDSDGLIKLAKKYAIKDCFELNSEGPIIFTFTKSDGTVDVSNVTSALNSNGEGLKSSAYDIKIYNDKYSTGNIERYQFKLPIESSELNFVEVEYGDLSLDDEIYKKEIQSSTNVYYSKISYDEAQYNKDNLYKIEKSDSAVAYIKDFYSWVRNRISCNRDAYYDYIMDDIEGSFEYRYSYIDEMDDSDIESSDIHRKYNGIAPIKNLVNWVSSICDMYDNPSTKNEATIKFKEEISKHFDLNYAYVYFLQMMMLAQADNAGKNSMWDTWDGNTFYIRPYDMDTQCGLNNTGQYIIPPSAEISTNLSPRTIYAGVNVSNYGINWSIDNAHERFSSFSTTTSRFWDIFGIVLRDEIEKRYRYLRSCGIYSYEYMMSFYKSITINKIGEKFYNFDMNAKYLSRVDETIVGEDINKDMLEHVMGNRIDQFADWLKQRIIFCDSYFEYDGGDSTYLGSKIRSDAASGVDGIPIRQNPQFAVSVYSPMYIKLVTAEVPMITYVEPGDVCYIDCYDDRNQIVNTLYDGVGLTCYIDGGDKEMFLHGLGNIKQLGGISNIIPLELNLSNATKMTNFEISKCNRLSSLSFANMKNLRTLSVKNCVALTSTIDLSNATNLESIDLTGSIKISSIKLAPGCPLKDFTTYNINITSMDFDGLNNLENINIGNIVNNEVESDSNAITNLSVKNCESISVLDLRNYKKLTNLTISNCKNLSIIYLNDLTALSQFNISNCDNIQIIDCTGTTAPFLSNFDISRIPHLKTLHLLNAGSPISNNSGGIKLIVSDDMDMNVLNATSSNIHTIELVNNKNTFGTLDFGNFKQLRMLTLNNCQHVKVIENLTMPEPQNTVIFRDCVRLESIKNSTIYSPSNIYRFEYLFYKCEKLSDISSLTIINNNGTSANSALWGASISTDILKSVIDYTSTYTYTIVDKNSIPNVKDFVNTYHNLQNYYTKHNFIDDGYVQYSKISNIQDINSELNSLASITDWDIAVASGIYTPILINNYTSYTKINKIYHIDGSLIDNIPDRLRIDNIFITLLSGEVRKLYRWYNNNIIEIDTSSIYKLVINNKDYYKIATNEDIDDALSGSTVLYKRDSRTNKLTDASNLCRETFVSTSNKFTINDDTFDGLTNLTQAYAFFYSSKVFGTSANKPTVIESINNISSKAMRKIGSNTSGVKCLYMFYNTYIAGLSYDIFKEYNQTDGSSSNKFKVTIAQAMFANCSNFNGFYEKNEYGNLEFRYSTIDNGIVTSILPSTITDMRSMFSNTAITFDNDQLNEFLSKLTNVTNMCRTFSSCKNIKKIGNFIFKDLVNCTKFIGTFYGCSNLNIYNGSYTDSDGVEHEIPDGMPQPCQYNENDKILPFVLFDANTKYDKVVSMAALFGNCSSLSGHIYKNMFATANNNGAINIRSIGSLTDSDNDVNIPGSGTTTVPYGAFENTKVTSYDIEFLQNLPKLTNVSRLFVKNGGKESMNDIGNSTSLSGYYEESEYKPGISINLFKNTPNITTTSYMFAGNMLLWLPNDYIIDINNKYLDQDDKSYYDIKTDYVKDESNFDKITLSLNQEDSITFNNSSIFDNLKELKSCNGMFLSTIEYYNPFDTKCEDSLYKKYKYLRYVNGLSIDPSAIFKNNSELTNVNTLFANSPFYIGDNDYTAIGPELFGNCSKIENVSKMFMNNTFQKILPDCTIFNNCRSSIKDTSYMFYGCTEIDQSFNIGNNVPHLAYENVLSNILNDEGLSNYSKKTVLSLFDDFSTHTSIIKEIKTKLNSTAHTFDDFCKYLISTDDDDPKYKIALTKNKLLIGNTEYTILSENGNSIKSISVMPYISNKYHDDSTDQVEQNVLTTNDVNNGTIQYFIDDYVSTNPSIIKIDDIDVNYIDTLGSSGNYYKYTTTSGEIGYITKGQYNVGNYPVGAIVDISTTYNVENILKVVNTNNYKENISYIKPFRIYFATYDENGDHVLKPVSNTLYRPLSISQYSAERPELYSLTMKTNIDININAGDYYILPASIIEKTEINDILYTYREGLLASMPKLESASFMFAKCNRIYGQIPEDIFCARSESVKLKSLTNISGLFSSCTYLGTKSGTISDGSPKGYSILLYGGGSSERITSPNTKIMYLTDNTYYSSTVNDIDRYTFNSNDRYLVPSDWLAYAPAITNISYIFQGVASLGTNSLNEYNNFVNNDNEYISGSYLYKANHAASITPLELWMDLPDDLFAYQSQIYNAQYAFATVGCMRAQLTENFMKNSLKTLSNASYMFANTAITSLSSTNDGSVRLFENGKSVNNSLKNVCRIFINCNAIKSINTTFPRFCNTTKFSNMQSYADAFRNTELTIADIQNNGEETYINKYNEALSLESTGAYTYSYTGHSDNFANIV